MPSSPTTRLRALLTAAAAVVASLLLPVPAQAESPTASATTVVGATLAAPRTTLTGTQLTVMTAAVHLRNPSGVTPVRGDWNDANAYATCPCIFVATGGPAGPTGVLPQANNTRSIPLQLVSGTAQDGIWSGTTLLGAVNAGVWRPQFIYTADLHADYGTGSSPVRVPGLSAMAALNVRGSNWPVLTVHAPARPVQGTASVVTGSALLSKTHAPATGLRLAVNGEGCTDGVSATGAVLGSAIVARTGQWHLSTTSVNSSWCVRYGETAFPDARTGSWVAQLSAFRSLGVLTGTVTAAPVMTRAVHGTDVRVRGRAWPQLSGSDVRLQRLVGRSWREVGRAYTGPTGTYTLVATPPNHGVNTYRVLLRRNAAFTAAYSRAFAITAS